MCTNRELFHEFMLSKDETEARRLLYKIRHEAKMRAVEHVKELRAQGLSNAEIAKRLGCSESSVYHLGK